MIRIMTVVCLLALACKLLADDTAQADDPRAIAALKAAGATVERERSRDDAAGWVVSLHLRADKELDPAVLGWISRLPRCTTASIGGKGIGDKAVAQLV
jgi:hypothetical protein